VPVDASRRDQAWLWGYLAGLVALSALTEPIWLMLGLVLILALAGRRAGVLLRRAALATLLFSGMVSLAFAGYSLALDGHLPWPWLLTVNVRVLAMALLTFLFMERVNLFRALAFSRRLSLLLVLAMSQAQSMRRTLVEFRQGLESRQLGEPALQARYRAAARALVWLLDRALANAHESAQALRSRGFFQ